MKFYCDSCGAKYLIGDEKVRGKVLRIRCKKCDHIMVVKEPSRPTSAEHRSVGDLARRLRNTGTHSAVNAGGPPPPPAVTGGVPWFYSVAGQTYGPLSLQDLAGRFSGGDLGDEAYVWNETFDAWKPGKQVPELQSFFSAGSVRRPRSPTMAVSAMDVQSADPKPSNGVDAHSARPATGSTPAVSKNPSSQDLPSILKRASRSRADGKGQSALSRPPTGNPPAIPKVAETPGTDGRPALGKRGKVATEDRLRALRERLKGGSNLGSTGSLRERLKGVKKRDEPAPAPPVPDEDVKTVKGEVPPELLGAMTPGPEEVTAVAVSELLEPDPAESMAPTLGSLDIDSEEVVESEPREPVSPAVPESELTVRDVVAEARARASTSDTPAPAEMTVVDVIAEARAEASVEGVADAVTTTLPVPSDSAPHPIPELPKDDAPAVSADRPASADGPASADLAHPFFDAPVEKSELLPPSPTPPAPKQVEPPKQPEPAPAPVDNPAPTMGALFPEQTGEAVPSAPSGLRPISADAQKAVGRDDEHSASLLIQLDTVRKSKRRAQMIAAIAGVVVLLFAVAAGVVIFIFLDDDSRTKALAEQVEEGRRKAEANKVKEADVDNLKTYTKDELAELVVNLGEEEMPVTNGAEPDAGVEPDAASKPTRKWTPKPKDNRSALDKALASSSAGAPDKNPAAGGSRKSDKVAATGDRATVDVGRPSHLPNVGTGSPLLAGAGGTAIEGRKKDESDKAAPVQLPSSLTRADLQTGFKHIRRSAGQCLERNMKVSGPLPKSKVKVTVTIQGTGTVKAVGMDSAVKNTPFAACMSAHRGRWKFPKFAGRPMQVSKIFVLQ